MLSVSTVIFDGHDMGAGFEAIAASGFDAVEPAFIKGYIDFDESIFKPVAAIAMAHLLKQNGLKAAALSAHIDLGESDSADRLLRRADYAARIGAPIVVTNATTQNKFAGFEALLHKCLPEFAARGIILALENPGHGAQSLLLTGRAAAELMQSFDHPSLRINYDICNAMTYGALTGTALDDLLCALPYCANLHLKDVATRGPHWEFCAIGDGDVGYAELLPALLRQPDIPNIGFELPLRLYRPAKGDPIRRIEPLTLIEAQSAIQKSLLFFQSQKQKSSQAS